MIKYTVISIPVVHDNPVELDNKCTEIERYFYGRYFRLDVGRPETIVRRNMARVFWLVEEHYTQHIIDRLASGLFWARRATADEVEDLIVPGSLLAVDGGRN